jgi:hypothetical protein
LELNPRDGRHRIDFDERQHLCYDVSPGHIVSIGHEDAPAVRGLTFHVEREFNRIAKVADIY